MNARRSLSIMIALLGIATASTAQTPRPLWVAPLIASTTIDIAPDEEHVLTNAPFALWSVERGVVARAFDAPSLGARFSPDGRRILSVGEAGYRRWQYELWDVEAAVKTLDFGAHEGAPATAIAWSPTGEMVATGGADSLVRIWSTVDGSLVAELRGHTAAIRSLAFSRDRSRLVSADDARGIILWQLDKRTLERRLLVDPVRVMPRVCMVGFSGGGARVFATLADGTLQQWDTDVGEHYRSDDLGAPSRAIMTEAETTVVGNEDGVVTVHDLATGIVRDTVTTHAHGVDAITVSRTGMVGASLSWDEVRIWRTNGEQLHRIVGHTGRAVFTADGRSLVTAGNGRYVIRSSGDGIARTIASSNRPGFSIALSPDGASAAVGSDGIDLRETATGALQMSLPGTGRSPVFSVSWSPDGNSLAATGTERIDVWDLASRARELRLDYFMRGIWSVEYRGRELIAPAYTGFLVLDARTGDSLRFVPYPLNAQYAPHAISRDGARAVIVGLLTENQRLVRVVALVDLASAEVVRTYRVGENDAEGLAFSDDGRLLAATVGLDQTTIVWDAESGAELRRLPFLFGGGRYASVAFSPDGARLLVNHGHQLVLWELTPVAVRPDVSSDVEVTRLRVAPNPASTAISVELDIARAGQGRLAIVDVVGRRRSTIELGALPTGVTRIPLSCEELGSGIYRVEVRIGERVVSTSLIIRR